MTTEEQSQMEMIYSLKRPALDEYVLSNLGVEPVTEFGVLAEVVAIRQFVYKWWTRSKNGRCSISKSFYGAKRNSAARDENTVICEKAQT